MSGGYQSPPKEIMEWVDAPQTPAVLLSPARDKIAFLERSSSLLESERPVIKIAGLRIDPVYNTRSGIPLYTGISICELLSDGRLGPKLPILGLPTEPRINYVKWSTGSNLLAFTVRPKQAGDLATGLELWVADVVTRQAYRQVGDGPLFLNTLFYTFSWDTGNNLICLFVNKSTRGEPPNRSLVSLVPKVYSKDSSVQNGTYEELSEDDQLLLDWPFSSNGLDNVDSGFFPRTTELWYYRYGSRPEYERGRVVSMESRPYPTSPESVQEARRNITWRADTETLAMESSLCWVETEDDEDEDTGEIISRHDIVYTQSPTDYLNEKTATVICKLAGLYREKGSKPDRIWQSAKGHFETVVGLMSIQPQVQLDQLRVLISSESPKTPRQYYVNTVWSDHKKASRMVSPMYSNFPHPYPDLGEVKIKTIRYGEGLTATLYLPEYEPDEAPLPTILWAGPEDLKSGPTRASEKKFYLDIMSVPASPVLWLARRFAVLHPTLPIIGEEDEDSIGSYVDRLVSSAKAAIDAALNCRVSQHKLDPKRIAVGGHSYGASTAVNLLAHAPHGLFCCGIARSGAYESTPFGFQHKEKDLWEAAMIPNTTPFVFENIIKTPILLIHGELEINARALWAERFYKALEGNSAVDARLVVLPLGDDQYRGRKNTLHCLWEMDTWLQKYCIDQ